MEAELLSLKLCFLEVCKALYTQFNEEVKRRILKLNKEMKQAQIETREVVEMVQKKVVAGLDEEEELVFEQFTSFLEQLKKIEWEIELNEQIVDFSIFPASQLLESEIETRRKAIRNIEGKQIEILDAEEGLLGEISQINDKRQKVIEKEMNKSLKGYKELLAIFEQEKIMNFFIKNINLLQKYEFAQTKVQELSSDILNVFNQLEEVKFEVLDGKKDREGEIRSRSGWKIKIKNLQKEIYFLKRDSNLLKENFNLNSSLQILQKNDLPDFDILMDLSPQLKDFVENLDKRIAAEESNNEKSQKSIFEKDFIPFIGKFDLAKLEQLGYNQNEQEESFLTEKEEKNFSDQNSEKSNGDNYYPCFKPENCFHKKKYSLQKLADDRFLKYLVKSLSFLIEGINILYRGKLKKTGQLKFNPYLASTIPPEACGFLPGLIKLDLKSEALQIRGLRGKSASIPLKRFKKVIMSQEARKAEKKPPHGDFYYELAICYEKNMREGILVRGLDTFQILRNSLMLIQKETESVLAICEDVMTNCIL